MHEVRENARVKCTNCGGRLEGTMTFCPFCGVRQDVNLRQIHFRDLGTDASMPCPQCEIPLDVIEFDSEPKLRVERCTKCFGMFFNPGEIEALLESQTNPLVWIDPAQLTQIAADFGSEHRVIYRKCPMCTERMSHLNFGGQSGVILDRCGKHGVWVEGSELRRLLEWWRAGGKHIYQQREAEKAKRLYTSGGATEAAVPMYGSLEPEKESSWDKAEKGITVAYVIGSLAAYILD